MSPRLFPAALLVALATAGAAARGSEPAVRRFALVVGSNASDGTRPELRYAVSDARAMARVLEQLGGVGAENRVLLEAPDRGALLDGFAQLGRRIDAARGASARVEALVYYSGHSDESGLILGSERVSYAEVRQAIHDLGAQVRIAILDSCASGALVRPKGGRRVPPFLIDGSTAVRGHAFLTATTAEEAAQESDRIKGSYFTYALVTGLRGAADASRDGKVTLSEAYQFAFDETLARTESSRAGPQHPTYDIELVGSGDLVMTDLRGTSAALLLAEDLEGRIYLRGPTGQLVAELRKAKGMPMELGLEPGRYEVTLDEKGAALKGVLVLAEGSRALLSRGQLAIAPGEVVATRGPPPPSEAVNEAPPPTVAVDFALLWPISTNGAAGVKARNHLSIPILLSVGGALDGAALGTGMSWVQGRVRGLQAALAGNEARELSGVQTAVGFNTVVGTTQGLQLAGGFNWAQQAPWVAQGAVGFNVVDGPLRGAQVSGFFNFATETTGAQISAGANIAVGPALGLRAGTLRGLQVGVLNIAGETEGAQLSGGASIASGALRGLQVSWLNVAGEVMGAQLSTGGNLSAGKMLGLQGGLGLNVAGAAAGVQLSAGANLADLPIRGSQEAGGEGFLLQLAAGANYTHQSATAQVAALNVARDTAKVQAGVLNIAARRSDFQVGLVNFAEKPGVMLGLLNLSKDGYLTPAVWASDLGVNVGIKSGGRILYTALAAGWRPRAEKIRRFTQNVGLGVHLPAGRLFVDVDLLGGLFFNVYDNKVDDPAVMASLRAQLGWQIARHFAVVAGPTFNAAIALQGHELDLSDSPEWVEKSPGGRTTVRMYPGFVAGIQF